MTYYEIEKCLLFEERIKVCKAEEELDSLLEEIKNYLNEKYDAHLLIDSWGQVYETEYTEMDLERDKRALTSFINGIIESDPLSAEISLIVRDVKKGEASLENNRDQENYVTYVYTAYNNKISFPKNIIDFCLGSRTTKFQIQASINKPIVEGIIQSLKNYAISLSKPKEIEKGPMTSINNIFNPYNNVNVDVSVTIENARNMAENAGLSQAQLDEVNKRIDEIKELIESTDSKNKKWSKAEPILKWVAEQGIQIASFMVPLLCTLV